MCKIIILQNHSPAKRQATIARAWRYFEASGERDGFGAMWVSRSGKLAWVKSSSPAIQGHHDAKWADVFWDSLNADEPSDGGWLMMHGRTATCGVSVENTHPMLHNASAGLIHNGVVDSDRFQNVSTTCDSELLLHAWMSEGHKGLASVSGYFAFGLLQKRRDGWHAVVARDERASLKTGRTRTGWAWSTREDGLSLVGASCIGSHKPLHAAMFSPDGTCDLAFFKKGAPKVSLESGWAKASGLQRNLTYSDWPVRT